MVNSLNTKISLRKDDLSNWVSADPILLDGELVVAVDENGENLIKIGNGISTFIQLPYLYQNQFDSKQVSVKSLSQGFNVKSTPTSMATGVFSKADANFGVVHGIEAEIREGDDYAFVFNGNNLPLDGENFYQSHGEGSFSINPKNGLSGFYIGEDNLSSIIKAESDMISAQVSNDYVSKDAVIPEAGITKIATIGGKDIMIPKASSTVIRRWAD